MSRTYVKETITTIWWKKCWLENMNYYSVVFIVEKVIYSHLSSVLNVIYKHKHWISKSCCPTRFLKNLTVQRVSFHSILKSLKLWGLNVPINPLSVFKWGAQKINYKSIMEFQSHCSFYHSRLYILKNML